MYNHYFCGTYITNLTIVLFLNPNLEVPLSLPPNNPKLHSRLGLGISALILKSGGKNIYQLGKFPSCKKMMHLGHYDTQLKLKRQQYISWGFGALWVLRALWVWQSAASRGELNSWLRPLLD